MRKRGLDLIDVDGLDADMNLGDGFAFGSLKRARAAVKSNDIFGAESSRGAVPLASTAFMAPVSSNGDDGETDGEKKHRRHRKDKDKSEKSSKKKEGEKEKSEKSSKRDKSEKSSRKDKSEKSRKDRDGSDKSKKDRSEKTDKKKKRSESAKREPVVQDSPIISPPATIIPPKPDPPISPPANETLSKIIPPAASIHSTIIPPSFSTTSTGANPYMPKPSLAERMRPTDDHDSPPELSADDLADDSIDESIGDKAKDHKKKHKKHTKKDIMMIPHPIQEPTVNSQPTKTPKPITDTDAEKEEKPEETKIEEPRMEEVSEKPKIVIPKREEGESLSPVSPIEIPNLRTTQTIVTPPATLNLPPPIPTHGPTVAVASTLRADPRKRPSLDRDASAWRLTSRKSTFRLTPSVFIPIYEMHPSIVESVRGMPLPDMEELRGMVVPEAINHFFNTAREPLADAFRIVHCDSRDLEIKRTELNSKRDAIMSVPVDELREKTEKSKLALAGLDAKLESSRLAAESLQERVRKLKSDVVQETDESLHFGRFVRRIASNGLVYVLWLFIFLLRIVLSPFLNDENLPQEMTINDLEKRIRRARRVIKKNRELEESVEPHDDEHMHGILRYLPSAITNFFAELTE